MNLLKSSRPISFDNSTMSYNCLKKAHKFSFAHLFLSYTPAFFSFVVVWFYFLLIYSKSRKLCWLTVSQASWPCKCLQAMENTSTTVICMHNHPHMALQIWFPKEVAGTCSEPSRSHSLSPTCSPRNLEYQTFPYNCRMPWPNCLGLQAWHVSMQGQHLYMTYESGTSGILKMVGYIEMACELFLILLMWFGLGEGIVLSPPLQACWKLIWLGICLHHLCLSVSERENVSYSSKKNKKIN